ncbi:hypothetical protein ENSA7_56340 [Enhygromyxa salina]|uniref:Uncharacterized protein n=1 Tax=Enhygromyxa salina TaxID=215803 RepID=A0A2S9YAL5_9BACT|nr:hypothetical protein ENSA7_56340 [Enhygromyxa salina]
MLFGSQSDTITADEESERRFASGETVPPCGSCELLVPLLLCADDGAVCSHPESLMSDSANRTPNDARVSLAEAPCFESLEAMLAWRLYPQRCNGVIRYHKADFGMEFDQATSDLGFARCSASSPSITASNSRCSTGIPSWSEARSS